MKRLVLLALMAFLVAGLATFVVAMALLPDDNPDEMSNVLPGTPTVLHSPVATLIPPPPTPDPVRNVPEVMLFEIATRQALPLWRTDFFVVQAEFSADGKWLYYVAYPPREGPDGANIYRLDLRNPQNPAVYIDRGFAMRISSQGDLAYMYVRDKEDYLPTVLTADGSRHELQPGIGFRAFVWSPDGRWLAYKGIHESGAPTYPEYLVDTVTWQQRTYTEAVPCQCDGNPVPVWSPDSNRFSYLQLTASGELPLLFDAATLTSAPSPRNEGWVDSESYVASRNDGRAIEFFLYSTTKGMETRLAGPSYASPDGRLLATVTGGDQDPRTTVVAVEGATLAGGLEGGFDGWSNDSSLVVTAANASNCGARTLLIHDARSGTQLLCRNAPIATSATLSPDSRLLALFMEPFGPPGSRGPFVGDLEIIEIATDSGRRVGEDIRGFGGACLKWSPDSRFVVVGVCEGI